MRTIRVEIDVPDKCSECNKSFLIGFTLYCEAFLLKDKSARRIYNNKPCRQCREATVKEG